MAPFARSRRSAEQTDLTRGSLPARLPKFRDEHVTAFARICVTSVHRDLFKVFTGLIEEVGSVHRIEATDQGTQLLITAQRTTEGIKVGDSVAVNGCCLTVAAQEDANLAFDLLEETLDRTNLKTLRANAPVNLERALAANARLGGHFVQGHIDCAVEVLAREENGADQRIEIELPPEFAHYVAFKGSIAVNGISLTVAEVLPHSFVVWIIPHTSRATNLHSVRVSDLVNLEFDLIAKYLERMLDRHGVRP